jgi:small-conductance mechanosensitive channel
MFTWHILSALSIGIIVSNIVFALGFRRRLHWSNVWIFFIATFLGAWAGGVWIPPFGPTIFNIHWLPFLLAGVVTGLLLLVASIRTLSPRDHTKEEVEFSRKKLSGLFIWTLFVILSVGLIVAIVVGYVRFGYAKY